MQPLASGRAASHVSLLTCHVSPLGGAGVSDSPLGSTGGIEDGGGEMGMPHSHTSVASADTTGGWLPYL